MTEFEEYLHTLDANPKAQGHMKQVLSWVSETFPQLEPVIKWNQPMFLDHGTFIIGFSASKQHMSVSPEVKVMDLFADELKGAGYTFTKGLFRIKYTQEIPYDILKRMIEFNLEDKKDFTNFWR